MSTLTARLKKSEFEARIFVSLGIVAAVTLPSLLLFRDAPSPFVIAGALRGADAGTATSWGYGIVAAFLALLSIFRMWAGSILTPQRVMAFKIQVDQLNTEGPYRIVRNPIYLADLSAMCAFALCLPWIGLVMPVLFALHYSSIIRYEEVSLSARYGEAYSTYSGEVPRLLPSPRRLAILPVALREFRLTPSGVRHNALFALFVPGMCVAAYSQNFLHALLIGLPGVIDWAVIHTVIGTRKRASGAP
jgi:protein-S-isoprenylcysteine O-methyltransferase Ste14